MLSMFSASSSLRHFAVVILMAGCSSLASIGFAQASKQACESLQMPHLEKTDLLSTTWVMAGAYTPPKPYPSAKTMEYQLSGHCILKLAAHPSADSDIRVELWLPEAPPGTVSFSPPGTAAIRVMSPTTKWPKRWREAMPSAPQIPDIRETTCPSGLGTRRRSGTGRIAALMCSHKPAARWSPPSMAVRRNTPTSGDVQPEDSRRSARRNAIRMTSTESLPAILATIESY